MSDTETEQHEHHHARELLTPEASPAVPTWLVAAGISVGILFSVGGGVGAYAVMGWRVQALEARLSADEVDIKAVQTHTGGQDVVLAEVKVEMKSITKSVDAVGASVGQTNALLVEVIKHLPQDHR